MSTQSLSIAQIKEAIAIKKQINRLEQKLLLVIDQPPQRSTPAKRISTVNSETHEAKKTKKKL